MRYFVLVWLALAALGLYGWITNIVTLVHTAQSHAPIDAMMALRGLGIFVAPLGAFLGFI